MEKEMRAMRIRGRRSDHLEHLEGFDLSLILHVSQVQTFPENRHPKVEPPELQLFYRELF